MISSFVVSFACLAFIGLTNGYPTGAPPLEGVCKNMFPGHGVDAQNEKMPYTVILSKSQIQSGEPVKVTIKGEGETKFRGFLVQARHNGMPIGQFSKIEESSPVSLLDCGAGKNNAITQNEPSDKPEITVVWTAPSDFKGKVDFYVTIVQTMKVFWALVKTATLEVQ